MSIRVKRAAAGRLHERRASIALVGAAVIAMLAGLGGGRGGSWHCLSGQSGGSARGRQRRLCRGARLQRQQFRHDDERGGQQSRGTEWVAGRRGRRRLVASPSGDGNSAVQVTVTTATPLYLAKVFQSSSTLSVSATSYAEVKPDASACIIALKAGGTGVTLSGGTAITGASCSVASDATVTVPCGTTITTKTLDYNSAAVPSQPCGGIKPPAGTASVNIIKVATADPLGG